MVLEGLCLGLGLGLRLDLGLGLGLRLRLRMTSRLATAVPEIPLAVEVCVASSRSIPSLCTQPLG